MAKGKIQKKVLSEQIREQLMESILNGEIKPGQKLVENTVANEFGVSQAPVREAFRSLEVLGFLSVEPYRGTTVKDFKHNVMEEYFVVRSALEGLAGRLAAENITKEELEKLEILLKDMIEAAETGVYERRSEINHVFHNKIIEASHNSLLINICKNIKIGSWSRITSKYTTMDADFMATRHKTIIDCLRAGDADEVEKILRQHIKDSMDNFNAEFYKNSEEKK